MQLNRELRERLDDAALEARFTRNIGILSELADEMKARLGNARASFHSARLTDLFVTLGM
jgi:hypothetical protein